jgi:hypothetical protein
MNTELSSNGLSSSELPVDDWRFQQLLRAGWPEQQARPLRRLRDPALSERQLAVHRSPSLSVLEPQPVCAVLSRRQP